MHTAMTCDSDMSISFYLPILVCYISVKGTSLIEKSFFSEWTNCSSFLIVCFLKTSHRHEYHNAGSVTKTQSPDPSASSSDWFYRESSTGFLRQAFIVINGIPAILVCYIINVVNLFVSLFFDWYIIFN